jgi:hypothetical protein
MAVMQLAIVDVQLQMLSDACDAGSIQSSERKKAT